MNTEFHLPELGENITGGDIVKVLVQPGQVIAANDGVVELETDKAVIELPCPYAGKIAKILVKPGQKVKIGEPILVVETEHEAAAPVVEKTPAQPAASVAKSATTASPAAPANTAPATAAEPLPAGPAARRLGRELGVDLHHVQGTGQGGRITPEDVQAAAAAVALSAPGEKPQPSPRPSEPVTPPGEAGQDPWGPIRRDRLTKIRQTIAAQMARAASIIPHVTNFDDADVTDLDALRTGVPEGFLGPGVKLTLMPFLLKAVAMGLKRHPVLNASLDEAAQQVIYKEYVNVGVAVDTPRGLVVPVMRGVDCLTIPQIARELTALAARARSAQFGVEDLRGGTFTISNLGAVGGTYSTPIINHPEVAVLLSGKARWLPVVREGRIEPRRMLPLSLSYDHRLVDGAAAGRFLTEVIGSLQSPGMLCLLP